MRARTSPFPSVRAAAVRALSIRDPIPATGRICARVLRLDMNAKVRRSAAECLGRLPEPIGVQHMHTLISALVDDDVDVGIMAAWALSNVGDSSAFRALADRTTRADGRAADYFYDYTERVRLRNGLLYADPQEETTQTANTVEIVPAARTVYTPSRTLNVLSAVSWGALYLGSAGWLHAGLYTATYGGSFKGAAPLLGAGAFALGALAGGTYSFLRADTLLATHTIVHMGVAGTAAGFGLGAVAAGTPTDAALNMATFGLSGTVFGTAFGIIMNETAKPSAGALALGAVTGFGSGAAIAATAHGFGYEDRIAIGAGLLAGGGVAALTTMAIGTQEIGLFPSAGALLGGAGLGSLLGVTLSVLPWGINDDAIRAGAFGFASGWALGAVSGGALAFLIPSRFDPLIETGINLKAPSVAWIQSPSNPAELSPVGVLGGNF